MSKLESYVSLRLDGLNDAEASERAGYERSKTPQAAREAWSLVEDIRKMPEVGEWVEKRYEELRQRTQEVGKIRSAFFLFKRITADKSGGS